MQTTVMSEIETDIRSGKTGAFRNTSKEAGYAYPEEPIDEETGNQLPLESEGEETSRERPNSPPRSRSKCVTGGRWF